MGRPSIIDSPAGHALLLLLKTEISIAEIAERNGFESTPYFSRRFAHKIGISPLRFRKRSPEVLVKGNFFRGSA
ncbi:helix-turn-helix domain-containing protein [Paenibacillus sp. BR2-3]|uniref:helix-turn-helix domain-containing protein n=1 Tax=Paenibacillus sp. BR2-3 TaxID=3048494 RepID=UPI003977AE30